MSDKRLQHISVVLSGRKEPSSSAMIPSSPKITVDEITASVNFTNLSLTIFQPAFGSFAQTTVQKGGKLLRSSISSLVRIWKICHSSSGCSFIMDFTSGIFSSKTLVSI